MKCFDDAGVRVWCSSVASGRPSSGGGVSSSPSSGGSAPPPREREISRSTPPKELFTSARAVAPEASAKQAAPAEPAEPAEAGNAAPAAPSALPGAVGFQRDAAEDKAEHSPQYLCKFFGERCDEAAAAKSDDDAPACAPNCSHHQRTQQRAQQRTQHLAQLLQPAGVGAELSDGRAARVRRLALAALAALAALRLPPRRQGRLCRGDQQCTQLVGLARV